MKIGGGISENQGTHYRNKAQGTGQNEDRVISGLKKQITRLEEQLNKLTQNDKMSPKEKTDKRNEITQEITDLNSQITQREMEIEKKNHETEVKKVQEKMEKTSQEKEMDDKTGFSKEAAQVIISAEGAMKQTEAMNHVKTQMSGQAHALKGEIAMEESMGKNPVEKKSQLEKTEAKVSEINAGILDQYARVNEDLKESNSEKVNKEQSTEEKLKEKNAEEEKLKKDEENKEAL